VTRPDLRAAIADFERWHQDPRNRRCHDLGIPLITLAALGLLARAPIDLGLALLATSFALDLWLEKRLALAVLAVGLALWAAGRALPAWGLGASFALGWVLQLLGHRAFEKNAPAFTTNLAHLAVGPRWLVNRWFRVLGDR